MNGISHQIQNNSYHLDKELEELKKRLEKKK